MDDKVTRQLMNGVARPCPDCAEERLFVPADLEDVELGEFCCTWCGAGLFIDPAYTTPARRSRHVA